MSRLLVATRSVDKLTEIRRLLAGVPHLEVVDLDGAGIEARQEEDEIEIHSTFEENALAKARYFHRRGGLPTVADDSGLVVDALGGRPGVRSKRFAPEAAELGGLDRDRANNRHLLSRLEGVPESQRTARYVCVAAVVAAGREPRLFRGEVEGRILEAGRGSGGFGYDPLFHHTGLEQTFAEVTRDEKSTLSHRGEAFRRVAAHLALGPPPDDPGPGTAATPEP